MKNIIYFLGALFVAIAAAFIIHGWLTQYNDPGYVLIGFGHWALETSLVVFAVSSVIAFFVFYVFFRFLGWLLRLPSRMKEKGKTIKFNRSQEALIAGLVDSAEGNWERAEKVLIKHASNSGAPLLHYLTAAKAAQSRGAFEKRDEYLSKAAEQASDSDIAVGLTQAELHLSEKQFEQALQTLSKLHSIEPGHASVLKMLHQAYQLAGDWEGLRKLIPSLHKNKILMEAEVKLLETETYSRLLKQAAEEGDEDDIQQCWDSVPEHIRTVQGIAAIYYAAMIEAGAGAKIEGQLVNSLVKSWDETLLVLYGNIESADFAKQLQTGEQWLAVHHSDAVLLRVLGKISMKCGQMEKAEQYLAKSVATDPSVAGYQLLGDLLLEKGDKDKASDCFKRGLELASNEVVSRVESISG
ncbi:heme biosynthesis HemY N-terminal domain-containing protein [Methylomarinum sp. Ch1-1]|uniref:Heme biosynthesis HemY N-terminal domain-containing protein n=1 Tax=Methylomarinum roseum TaxID=3067653 RepID=A0AAU7NXX6_9GAMM|nr:heme biosynthesis HemY N-terminal domain-containing protein [Methylomarinum sp. Ch1-1]MDP4521989.1 heme biosynthesis HemY N-terminal domain-containing protein [Methylomarinum sp. Ch1-1]